MAHLVDDLLGKPATTSNLVKVLGDGRAIDLALREIPLPPRSIALMADLSKSGAAEGVYRTKHSLADAAAFFARALPDSGWSVQGRPANIGTDRWFGRFERGGRICLVMCMTANAARTRTNQNAPPETLVVIQTAGAP